MQKIFKTAPGCGDKNTAPWPQCQQGACGKRAHGQGPPGAGAAKEAGAGSHVNQTGGVEGPSFAKAVCGEVAVAGDAEVEAADVVALQGGDVFEPVVAEENGLFVGAVPVRAVAQGRVGRPLRQAPDVFHAELVQAGGGGIFPPLYADLAALVALGVGEAEVVGQGDLPAFEDDVYGLAELAVRHAGAVEQFAVETAPGQAVGQHRHDPGIPAGVYGAQVVVFEPQGQLQEPPEVVVVLGLAVVELVEGLEVLADVLDGVLAEVAAAGLEEVEAQGVVLVVAHEGCGAAALRHVAHDAQHPRDVGPPVYVVAQEEGPPLRVRVGTPAPFAVAHLLQQRFEFVCVAVYVADDVKHSRGLAARPQIYAVAGRTGAMPHPAGPRHGALSLPSRCFFGRGLSAVGRNSGAWPLPAGRWPGLRAAWATSPPAATTRGG
ncbi:MAG: hypothetical protein JPMHGGIA_02265 [Saprospiraceae bacterium]|nr:hypothetical protein [Saprospiraceae bacterium]